MKPIPRVVEFRAIDSEDSEKLAADISWSNGTTASVVLGTFLRRFVIFKPVLENAELFASPVIEDGGLSIAWSEDMTLAASTLWRLSMEQAGELMPWEDFKAWRERNKLTQTEAAKVLGISRRRIADYESGFAFIPKTVLLATKGYETEKVKKELAVPVYHFTELLRVFDQPHLEESTIDAVLNLIDAPAHTIGQPLTFEVVGPILKWYKFSSSAGHLFRDAVEQYSYPAIGPMIVLSYDHDITILPFSPRETRPSSTPSGRKRVLRRSHAKSTS